MLIAFEGIDASGKSTQAKILAEKLHAEYLKFPNYGTPVGEDILRILKREIQASPGELQGLMTVNRYEFYMDLRTHEKSTQSHIVLDRYSMSALVYGQADGLPLWWLTKMNSALPQPTITILIDIPTPTSFDRRPMREDAYESSFKRLEKARMNYLNLVPEEYIIDGTQAQEEISYQVLALVKEELALS